MGCPFCEKLSRLDTLPDDELVWQFPHSVALLGPWQDYTGYCILVARRHAHELFHLTAVERRSFLDEMCLLARAIHQVTSPRKINYELLGNQVPHLHWHLFPRRHDDPDHLKPVWLSLEHAEQDAAVRARLQSGPRSRREVAAELRAVIERLTES